MVKMGKKIKFKIPCQADVIPGFIKNLFSTLDKYEIKIDNFNFRIELAAREMLANAIEHGSKVTDKEDQQIKNMDLIIILKITHKRVKFSVEDAGDGFNWNDCDLEYELTFQERGRGLKMINEVVDEIEFNKQGNKITVYFDTEEKIK